MTLPKTERKKAWLAVLLAWVAGGVDAIGFLTLLHLFTAQMSGNSIAMTAYVGQGHWAEAARRAFPIPLFVLGVALGAALMEWGKRGAFRSPSTLTLGLEALLLLTFLAWGQRVIIQGGIPPVPTWRFYGLAALLPLAMGLQNAALRRGGGKTVRTTHVTGTLTDLAEGMVEMLFRLWDRSKGRGMEMPSSRAALAAGIYAGYVVGGVLGSLAESRWMLEALALPLVGLAVVIGVDLRQPSDRKLPQ
jgi:uncharacterized membrane protein YoaK (UPF0700 family)